MSPAEREAVQALVDACFTCCRVGCGKPIRPTSHYLPAWCEDCYHSAGPTKERPWAAPLAKVVALLAEPDPRDVSCPIGPTREQETRLHVCCYCHGTGIRSDCMGGSFSCPWCGGSGAP